MASGEQGHFAASFPAPNRLSVLLRMPMSNTTSFHEEALMRQMPVEQGLFLCAPCSGPKGSAGSRWPAPLGRPGGRSSAAEMGLICWCAFGKWPPTQHCHISLWRDTSDTKDSKHTGRVTAVCAALSESPRPRGAAHHICSTMSGRGHHTGTEALGWG